MTRKDYDVEHLIRLLRGLKERYPHLRIILEYGICIYLADRSADL